MRHPPVHVSWALSNGVEKPWVLLVSLQVEHHPWSQRLAGVQCCLESDERLISYQLRIDVQLFGSPIDDLPFTPTGLHQVVVMEHDRDAVFALLEDRLDHVVSFPCRSLNGRGEPSEESEVITPPRWAMRKGVARKPRCPWRKSGSLLEAAFFSETHWAASKMSMAACPRVNERDFGNDDGQANSSCNKPLRIFKA